MPRVIAHIIDFGSTDAVSLLPAVCVAVSAVVVAGLTMQNHVVKYGRVEWSRVRRVVGIVVALSLGAVLAPSTAQSQERFIPAGLPDLISDPPFIWFQQLIDNPDGSQIRVLSFDGYLHNIGEGMLDVTGNPQEPGGMRQRYYDGDDWIEVGEPNVIYETTDGHNHFHLMAAASYELWNEARTEKLSDAAKVGFCLLDSLQRDDRYESTYDIIETDYCRTEKPDTDNLQMGITPGWVDVYDANTTLQWVDVSNQQPGVYWVGAIMDPDDQVLESNEDNNGLVFSENKFPVTGYVARSIPEQLAGEPIRLKASAYDEVGPVVWSIVDGPDNGAVSVPLGVDLFDEQITYVPDAGFDGVDSFSYTARDLHSRYPLEPLEITVTIDASSFATNGAESSPSTRDDTPAPTMSESEGFTATEATRFSLDATTLVEADELDASVRWYSSGLPPGLTINERTGLISGVPVKAPPANATLVAVSDSGLQTIDVPWTVEANKVSLADIGDMSTALGAETRRYVGTVGGDAREYSATGLPPGISGVSNVPLLGGTAEEVGVYDVEVLEMLDGEVLRTSNFTWTVRPSAIPRFAN